MIFVSRYLLTFMLCIKPPLTNTPVRKYEVRKYKCKIIDRLARALTWVPLMNICCANVLNFGSYILNIHMHINMKKMSYQLSVTIHIKAYVLITQDSIKITHLQQEKISIFKAELKRGSKKLRKEESEALRLKPAIL